MQSQEYRECLKDALTNLVKVNESICDLPIPIAMTGELKEWSKSGPIGEIHAFDFKLFRNCADTNVQLLVKLIKEIDVTYQTIKNLNTIQMEEEMG